MNQLLIGLVGAMLATNQPQAVSNLIQQQTGVSVQTAVRNDPAEQELEKLMAEDDAAQAEVDQWIRDNNAFATQGAGESKEDLNKRILARFDSVRKDYEDFLRRHPDSAHGHLAYGSFLNDMGDEGSAMQQYEISRRLDPKNPAAWNNLANYFGEHGSVTNSFAYYAEAIKLNPSEPVYYENFATTVYLFRKDAEEFYNINEQQVFDKALELYREAMRLDPKNFPLATDYAQSYYGIRPLRTNDALIAWTNALQLARDDVEREGIYIHLARVKIAAGHFGEVQPLLDAVTNAMYGDLKKRLERNLVERENPATNPPEKISANIAAEETNSISTNAMANVNSAIAKFSTNLPAATNAIAPTNSPPEISTNIFSEPANKMVLTNESPVLTNEPPTLPNPPIAITNSANILTNVPPIPPKPLQMEMPAPTLRPLPQTNAP